LNDLYIALWYNNQESNALLILTTLIAIKKSQIADAARLQSI